MKGLSLVTVPIGNFDDITVRAKNKLAALEVVVAEDTRVAKLLMQGLGIDYSGKKILSFHEHSSDSSLEKLLEYMQGQEVGYISDAGSPALSDPALPLIQACLERGLEVESIPGVSAVTTAIELCALPSTPFHFHGFLARDKSKREEFTQTLSEQYGLHIFFEGVARVEKVIDELSEKFEAWQFCVCRELTKTFQSVHRFKGHEWKEVKSQVIFKGEFVVLVYNPNRDSARMGVGLSELAQSVLESGAKPKQVAKLLSEILSIPTKEVYSRLEKRKER